MLGFGGSALQAARANLNAAARISLSKTARASINLCPPLRFLRQTLKNFYKFCARKTEARSRRSRDFGRPFSATEFYKADLQKGRKGAELSGAIVAKGDKSYMRNRKRR